MNIRILKTYIQVRILFIKPKIMYEVKVKHQTGIMRNQKNLEEEKLCMQIIKPRQ
jgi:hypothetical protein